MERNWTPVRSLDYLFGEEMATRLAHEAEKRAHARNAARQKELETFARIAELQTASLGTLVSQDARETLHKQVTVEADAFLAGAPDAPPSDPTDPMVERFPVIPSPHSCVGSAGPYNSWGGSETGGAGEATLRLDPGNARLIGARCVYLGAGAGHVWGGSGCWFRAGVTGVARLRLSFVTNGRSIVAVTLPPFGYAHTHIRFWGSAWGAAEGRWVDRGGFGADLFVGTYYGSRVYDLDLTSITGNFDTTAGGYYYCAGGFDVWSGAGGIATAGSSFWSLLQPLQMCEP